MGGLKTPRVPAEKVKEKVINKDNIDVTKEYQKGAQEVLALAQKFNIKKAIFKSKSPSCGKGKIYDGTFSDNLVNGNGVATELLEEHGIKVISSDDI